MSLLLLFHGTPTPTEDTGGLFVEVGFGAGPGYSPDSIVWTDVTDDVMAERGVTAGRGRSSELDSFQAGTCGFTLINADRKYDPEYADGDLFGDLLPLTPVRVRYVIDDVSYPVGYGFVNGWPQTYDQPKHAESKIAATDSFRVLAAADLPEADWSRESASDRVAAILFNISWPGASSVDTSHVILSDDEMTGKALSALQTVEAAEYGRLYVMPDGTLRFEARHSRVLETRSTTSQMTFSDTGVGHTYADLAYDYSDKTIVNDARRTGASGVEQSVEDATSIGQYLRRVDSASAPNDVDPQLYSVCEYIVDHEKDPSLRITQLVVHSGTHDPDLGALLTLGISDQVTVIRSPQGVGDPITQNLWIEGVNVTVGPLKTLVDFTFYLSPVLDTSTYMMLDDPVLGLLEANAVGF